MPTWRLVRKHKIALLTLALMLILGGLALHIFAPVPGMESCAVHGLGHVPGPGGYDANVMEEGCDGISGSDTISVVLTSRKTSHSVTVFAYGLEVTDATLSNKNVYPVVTWSAKDRLRISVRAISYVNKKLGEADGVKIDYDIGSIEYK